MYTIIILICHAYSLFLQTARSKTIHLLGHTFVVSSILHCLTYKCHTDLQSFLCLCSHNVIFKTIPGAAPFLLILNEFDQVLEKLDLSELSREECNNLLLDRGFYKKSTENEDVPEKYRQGPYHTINQEL